MHTTATLPMPSSASSDISLNQRLAKDYWDIIFNVFFSELFPFQGLLLLDQAGRLVQSNPRARELCLVLQKGRDVQSQEQDDAIFPDQVVRHYGTLIANHLKLPDKPFQVNEEICLDKGICIQLTIERVLLGKQRSIYFLVRLEDVTKTACHRACWDAFRYRLTSREQEVRALSLQGVSYQEMGERLFIAKNTVRKHVKSIYSKLRDAS